MFYILRADLNVYREKCELKFNNLIPPCIALYARSILCFEQYLHTIFRKFSFLRICVFVFVLQNLSFDYFIVRNKPCCEYEKDIDACKREFFNHSILIW